MESTTPGLVAQFKRRLTTQRYNSATVFVDHYSKLSYIHLQTSLSSLETEEAKRAFKEFSKERGVRIQHYHADNGRFVDNLFIESVIKEGQKISYCDVNTHWQNGIAEKRIRDLTEGTRKQLLNAKSRWSRAITLNLWPYSLRMQNHLHQISVNYKTNESPMKMFSKVKCKSNLNKEHTFGCPVYVLNASLQAGNTIQKWDQRARLGTNLGSSPHHARSVSLILNLTSGLVSPQFHIIHDNFFETVRPGATDEKSPSLWQRLSGFAKGRLDKPEGAQNLNIPERTAIPNNSQPNPVNTQFSHEDINLPTEVQNEPLPEDESTEIQESLTRIKTNHLKCSPMLILPDYGTRNQ